MSPRPLVVLGALCLACSGDPYGAAPRQGNSAGAPAEAGAEAKPAGGAEAKPGQAEPGQAGAGQAGAQDGKGPVPAKYADGKPLGKVLDDAPLPLAQMLGQPPPQVESLLGPPLPEQKGGKRSSCVRFLPERTWFRCQMVWQRYSDKTGTFGVVQVTYEDGKAAMLAFEGIPGAGGFEPKQALRKVGLELPGTAKLHNPAPDVTVWTWFNSEARLLVHGKQYRVEVSTVGGKWETAKVEIVLNDALTPEQEARVIEPGGEGGDGAEGGEGGNGA